MKVCIGISGQFDTDRSGQTRNSELSEAAMRNGIPIEFGMISVKLTRTEIPKLLMNNQSVSRRRFVKTFSLGTAFSTLLGKPWQASVLADITPSDVGVIRVRLSDFPVLSESFGSVRLGINLVEDPSSVLGLFYPVIITNVGGEFYAVNSQCRHAGCIVLPFIEEYGGIFCPCHGSGYAFDGRLLNGPANSDLHSYECEFDGVDLVTVKVPSLGYCVTGSLAVGAATPRFRLAFPTFENVEYEVRLRTQVDEPGTVVPFSLSLDGPADQFSILGDLMPATVFVERSAESGFYTVDIKLFDLPTQG